MMIDWKKRKECFKLNWMKQEISKHCARDHLTSYLVLSPTELVTLLTLQHKCLLILIDIIFLKKNGTIKKTTWKMQNCAKKNKMITKTLTEKKIFKELKFRKLNYNFVWICKILKVKFVLSSWEGNTKCWIL